MVRAGRATTVDESITIPQFRTLVILASDGPVNLATLAGLLGVRPSTTGRMVDRLVTTGLIERKPHPTSRRQMIAGLTVRGREIVRQVTAHRRDEIARIAHTMPAAERRGLARTLTAFAKAGGEPPAGYDIDAS